MKLRERSKAQRRAAMPVAVLLAAVLAVALAACSGGSHDHGKVVGELTIPYIPGPAGSGQVAIPVHVKPGERFSIKVHTSDGPYWWTQLGHPLPSLVRLAGNFNDGSCPMGMVGCRVPYFHTLIARRAGTTTMTWKYHAPGCQSAPNSAGCVSTAMITFDITVR